MPKDEALEVDAVVSGGGIAGVACAAALAELGWSVLLVEPGQHHDRRLAGELLHPSCIDGLSRLGLLPPDPGFAQPIHGFTVHRPGRAQHLPYPERQAGAACDHGTLRDRLLGALADLPGVRLCLGARVVALAPRSDGTTGVTLAGGDHDIVRCRLVVAADGAASPTRRFAGIPAHRRRVSRLTAYTVPDRYLPAPLHAHVCPGPGGPALAYPIGGGIARVLLDQPAGREVPWPEVLAALPAELHEAVTRAVQTQRGLRFDTAETRVAAVTRNRVVLVGDAAGSCHPLTASGMGRSVADALLLQAVLRQTKDIDVALARYSRRRREPQRARLLLAAALYDVLSAPAAGSAAIRAGLFRYWESGAAARDASMRLLAGGETTRLAILGQLARVARAALAGQASGALAQLRRMPVAARLSLRVLRYMTIALRTR